ncbi:hypothetical protein ACQXXB_14495 [Aeromonas veronii]|uniref:hypothetical protein n=1 Tax=Aeromonas TaxID=642 RepID=UPI000AA0EFFA|nr:MULTISPECIES: hypothetical protein [Aeromonas]
MMPTKTRPLARFSYLAFALSLFLLQTRLFSRNNRPIGHASRTASDLDLKIAVQV